MVSRTLRYQVAAMAQIPSAVAGCFCQNEFVAFLRTSNSTLSLVRHPPAIASGTKTQGSQFSLARPTKKVLLSATLNRGRNHA